MHHNDAPNLDPRTDIADLFVFQNPHDLTRSILILNVNPEAPTRADTFDPRASYELKIDTNGDFEAEIAFHVLFATLENGGQIATVYRSTDAAARGTGPVGEVILQDAPVSFSQEAKITTQGPYRFFAGLRASHSSQTQMVSLITCSGQAEMAGQARISLALCSMFQTVPLALSPSLGYGDER